MGKHQYMPAWASNITMSYNKYMAHRGAFIMYTLSSYVSVLNYKIHPDVLKYHIFLTPSMCFLKSIECFLLKKAKLMLTYEDSELLLTSLSALF